MKLDKHTYQYDTIVIGGGLNAKIYAYYNKCPCICGNYASPFRFDMLQEEVVQGLPGQNKNSLQSWETLSFILGLSGQLPMGDKVVSLNIRDNVLKATTKDSRLGRFEFNKLIVFDDKDVYGLPLIKEKKVGKSRVLDWFNVRSGMEHSHDLLDASLHRAN